MSFTVVDHPLISHKLSLMRMKDTPSTLFRQLTVEIAMLLCYEVTRDLPCEDREIETPLEEMKAPFLSGKKPCVVSILRAGNGFLDGVLSVMPAVKVGHIGLYRDPETLDAIEYYCKLPIDLNERTAILVDPMLGTANTAVAAIDRIKEHGVGRIVYMCLVAGPEGIMALTEAHPDVRSYTCAVDRQLNEKGYLLPGVGDAGDRIYGTYH